MTATVANEGEAFSHGSLSLRTPKSSFLALAVIVAMGAVLRLVFGTGIVHLDSVVYADLAHRLVHGGLADGTLPPRWSLVRVGIYGPVALAYALAGTSNATTIAWPLAASLAGICTAYAIGRRLAGEAAGLVAAFLWALLPTDVAGATVLLGDGIIATLSMGTVLCLLIAQSQRGWKQIGAYTAGAGCLVLAAAAKLVVLLVMPFLLVYAYWSGIRSRAFWLTLAGLAIAGGAFYYYATATPEMSLQRGWPSWSTLAGTVSSVATRWWTRVITGHQEYSWISPLWIVAVAALLAQRRRSAYPPLLWFGTTFLYLELGTRSPFTYEPLYFDPNTPTRHFLFIAAPLVIATGIYLADSLAARTARRLTMVLSVLVATAAWAGTRHAAHLSTEVTGEAIDTLPFAVTSALATAVVIFCGIASPIFALGPPARWKVAATAGLLLAAGLASLNPSYRASTQFRYAWTETFPEAVRYLAHEPALPIYVQNDVIAQEVDYASGFRYGVAAVPRRAAGTARLGVAPENPNLIDNAYVLLDDRYLQTGDWGPGPAYLKNPPASWAEITRFGKWKGNQLRLYRASREVTPDMVNAAVAATKANETAQTLRRLLDVATTAGDYCLAARTWDRQRTIDAGSIREFDPTRILSECYATRPEIAGTNLIKDGDFLHRLAEWHVITTPGIDVDVVTEGSNIPVAMITSHVPGQHPVLLQSVSLLPNNVYVFEATIKSTMPVVALYRASELGHYEAEAAFPAWRTLRSVFVTPAGDGQPHSIDVFPVLLKGAGQVWVRQVKVVKLHLDSPR